MPPQWKHLLLARPSGPHVEKLEEQNVAYPCIGFNGQGVAIRELLPKHKMNNVYDINPELKEVYKIRHGHAESETMHFGPVDGDITRVKLTELEMPTHGLAGGGHCEPWSKAGKKKGGDDVRAETFTTMARCGTDQMIGRHSHGRP